MTTRPAARHGQLDRWVEIALLICILAVAATLRLHDIESPSLWADEGNNAFFSYQSLPDLVRMCRLTNDTDPPAHRLALKLWLALAGNGARQMRSLSVLCNLLTIVAIWWWARRTSGSAAGLIAAAVFCFHPLAILYGREAKGYPFATLFCTLQCAIWADAIRLQRPPRAWAWLAATLCAALAIGTHYYVALSFSAQGVAMLAWWLVERNRGHGTAARRTFSRWIASCAVASAIVAPWVLLTYGPARQATLELRPEHGSWTTAQALAESALSLAGGSGPRNLYRLLAVVGLGGLASAALVRKHSIAWFPALLVSLPVALAALLQLAVPFYSVRFLYYVLGPLAVLVGVGWSKLDGIRWVPLGALAVAWAFCLPCSYDFPGHKDQDLRPIAEALEELAVPGDTVLVGYIWQEGILRQYAPDIEMNYELAWYQPDTVEADVDDLIARNGRLWLLSYRVPTQHGSNLPGGWLTGSAAQAWRTRHEGHTLALFLSPVTPQGDGLDLTWDSISATAWAPQSSTIQPSEWILVPMVWQITDRPLQPTVVFVHLVDSRGVLVAQQDGAPSNGLRLFRGMQAREMVEETRVLRVPDDAPPGEYRLLMGLYWPQTGQRLMPLARDADGDGAIEIGSVIVTDN